MTRPQGQAGGSRLMASDQTHAVAGGEREAPPAAGPTGELYHGAPTIANAQMTLQAESCSSPAQELLCGQSTTSTGITREPSDSPPRQGMEGQQPPGKHFQQRPGMNRLALPEPGTGGAFEQLVATPDQAKPAPPPAVALMVRFSLPLGTPCSHPTGPSASSRGRVALGVAVGHAEEIPQLLLIFWLLQCANSQGKQHRAPQG